MVELYTPEPMFKFVTKLHIWKARVKKNGYSSLYIQVYISKAGAAERDYLPLHIEWPKEKIDFDNSRILARYKNDEDVNDYNMIIMTERAKLNEIAKRFRLSGRVLTMIELQRELVFMDNSKTVVQYMHFKRNELLKLKVIAHQTYKHYGVTASRVEEFHPNLKFDEINKTWMDKFKNWLKSMKRNSHNTIWGRFKEFKALLRHASNEIGIYIDPNVLSYENKQVETPTTYLDRSEVQLLIDMYYNTPTYQKTFPKNRPLTEIENQVLPAFLFSCFTSLRISDIYAADSSWMMSDNFLTFTMAKNRGRRPKTIRIPIAPKANNLIKEGLSNKFFDLPTQQEYNRTLKDIAALAKIKKRLTSHVGRHTFGYLFMTSVGDVYALKEIMGHSKVETTQRYAHLDEDSKLEMVIKMQKSFV